MESSETHFKWHAPAQFKGMGTVEMFRTLIGSTVYDTQTKAFVRRGHSDCPALSLHLAAPDQEFYPEDTQNQHHEDEVYYVLEGRATFRIQAHKLEYKEWNVGPGDLVFVPRHVAHQFIAHEALKIIVFYAPDFSGGVHPEPSQANMPGVAVWNLLRELEGVKGLKTLMGTFNPETGLRDRVNHYQSMSLHVVDLSADLSPRDPKTGAPFDTQTPHWEDEVYLVLEGHGGMVVGNRPVKFDIAPGDLIFVPRFTFHRFTDYENLKLFVIFAPDYSRLTNMKTLT